MWRRFQFWNMILVIDITGKSSFSQSLKAGGTGSKFLVLEGKPPCAHYQYVFSDLKKDTRRNLTHPRNYSPGAGEAAFPVKRNKDSPAWRVAADACSLCSEKTWEELFTRGLESCHYREEEKPASKMGMAPYFILHKGGKHPILYSVALNIAWRQIILCVNLWGLSLSWFCNEKFGLASFSK